MTELDYSRVYSSQELNQLGYSSNSLTELIRNKKITRLQRGFYAFKEKDELKMIIQVFPELILCLESALYFYGYIEKPAIYPAAVHKSANRNKYRHSSLPLRAYFRDDKYIDVGVEKKSYQGVTVFVYDRERTICDCIRKKDEMDNTIYRKALLEYSKDENKDLARLMEYARLLRIEKKVKLLMDSLL